MPANNKRDEIPPARQGSRSLYVPGNGEAYSQLSSSLFHTHHVWRRHGPGITSRPTDHKAAAGCENAVFLPLLTLPEQANRAIVCFRCSSYAPSPPMERPSGGYTPAVHLFAHAAETNQTPPNIAKRGYPNQTGPQDGFPDSV
ncbi:hypothetical protein D3C75_710390 [compost metagenome]